MNLLPARVRAPRMQPLTLDVDGVGHMATARAG
jgi:hypothetical protein